MKHLLMFILLMPIVSADIFITEIMYDPTGNDNNLEYIELYSNESFSLENFTIEDLSSSDNLKLVHSSNSSYSIIVEEGFNYSNIDASIYSAGATIGNNLNNDRDIVIIKNSSRIFDAVNYDESLGGKDGLSLCRINSTLVQCYPTPGYENNIAAIENLSYNYSQVYNKTKNLILDSFLEIEKIYDKDIKFGDLLTVRIKVYKGDTRKKEIKLYVKDLSRQTKVLLNNRFTNYTLTLPLLINPKCNDNSSGYYDLVLEGLNQKTKERIKISGYNSALCQKITVKEEKIVYKSSKNSTFLNTSSTLANNSESIKYGKKAVLIYEASDAKAMRYAIYFFCFVLILIVAYYQFRKEK